MLPIIPPAATRAGSLVLAAAVGSETLERSLTLLAPLRRRLGRGDVVLVDDGTLTGADRVRAARACGDPQFVPVAPAGEFPAGPSWTLLLTALDGRQTGYWVLFGAARPADIAVPGLGHAIATNRSFALTGHAISARLEPHLAQLARAGLPYLPASPAVVGLAAGGNGRSMAAAIFARLAAVLGADSAHEPGMAEAVTNFLLAREPDPVLVRDKPGTVHSPGSI